MTTYFEDMDNYKEEKVLGRGQYGRASLCTQLSPWNKVVVKTLKKGVNTKQLNSFRKSGCYAFT